MRVAANLKSVWNFQRMEPQKKPRGMKGSAPKTPVAGEFDEMARRLKAERERRKLTQKQFGKLAGLSQPMISQLETGSSAGGVRLISVYRMAKALGWTMDQLVLGYPNFLAMALAEAVKSGAVNPLELAQSAPASEPAPDPVPEPAPRPQKQRRKPHG